MDNLPTPVFEDTLAHFYYGKQFKKYLIQFMAIFAGLQVQIGKNNLGSASDKIRVPIKSGSMDRVVAAIMAKNTQNLAIRVPILSAKIIDIQINTSAMKGTGVQHRESFLPLGQSLPDGVQVVRRRMPVPYELTFELGLYASNTDQQMQMLEQILLLFDPILQFQTSDASWDWTKINTLEIGSINLEENYPAGQDRRMLTSSITFTTTVYLSAPIDYKQDYVKSVKIRISEIPTGDDTERDAHDIVDRGTPPYDTLFDIEDYDIPPT